MATFEFKYPKTCAWCAMQQGVKRQECNWYFPPAPNTVNSQQQIWEKVSLDVPICEDCLKLIQEPITKIKELRKTANIIGWIGLSFFCVSFLGPIIGLTLPVLLPVMGFFAIAIMYNLKGDYFKRIRKRGTAAKINIVPARATRYWLRNDIFYRTYEFVFFDQSYNDEFNTMNRDNNRSLFRLLEKSYGENYPSYAIYDGRIERTVGTTDEDENMM